MNALISYKGSSSELLYYIAGLIDGEGSIGMFRMNRNQEGNITYGFRIQIAMTVEAPLAAVHMLFGGKLYHNERKVPNRKPVYSIHITTRDECLPMLEALRGKCLVKHEQVELGILYFNTIKPDARDPELRAAFAERFNILNGSLEE